MQKDYIFGILTFLVCSGCQLNQEMGQLEDEEKNTLVVEWEDHGLGRYSFTKPKVYLYDSEEAWSTPNAVPVASAVLPASTIIGGVQTVSKSSAIFENMPPKKYWVKVLGSDKAFRLIEHNQNLPKVLDSQLQNGTTTTTTVKTEPLSLKELTVNGFTVHSIPYLAENPSRVIKLTVQRRNPHVWGPGHLDNYYQRSVTHADFPLTITNISIPITTFKNSYLDPSYHIVFHNDTPFFIYEYEINVFNLIEENTGLYDQMIHKRQDGKIAYSLTGNWVTEAYQR